MPSIHKQVPLVNALTSATGFGLPFIGNPNLNKRGLHLWRIKCSDTALSSRQGKQPANDIAAEVVDKGVAVVSDFLPADSFAQLQSEIRQSVSKSEHDHPVTASDTERFGAKQHFTGGFDRYDAQTLNRFLDISSNTTPHAAAFLDNKDLQEACEQLTGTVFNPKKFQIYLTRQMVADNSNDPQLQIHRDTFFSCIKLWYFTEDVAPRDGPFRYCPGSHRMTEARLKWEQEQSIRAAKTNATGSFRISSAEVEALGCEPVQSYPVSANTLVMADVRGFHARAAASRAGAERLSIYGNIRPWPFAPIRYRC